MATTQSLREEFERYMDANGVKYQSVNPSENVVLVSFSSEKNDEGTRVFVDFDEEDAASTVHFCVQNFAKVRSQDLLPKALIAVNTLNRRFRWFTFTVDTEGLGISATCDAKVFPGSVGEECTELCFRAANIIEDSYDELDDIIERDVEETPSKEELLAMLKQLMDQLSHE